MEMDKELEKQAIESYLYCNKFFPRIWGKPNKKEHKLNTLWKCTDQQDFLHLPS